MIIREPNLNVMDDEFPSIPKDFADIMRYFNKGLKSKAFPYIPRKNEITSEEIKTSWVPSTIKNITILAEDNGKIIGSATVFYDPKSSGYENSSEREAGHVGMTVDPSFNYTTIGEALMKKIISKLSDAKKQAIDHIDVDFKEGNLIMQKLKIKGKEIFSQRYKDAGLSGKVIEYKFP